MKLQNYINGNKKGKNANRIEKDAMTDPFLAEALEGFDSVEGNHAATIRRLQSKIAPKPKKNNVVFWRITVAAAVVIFVWGTYLFFDNHKTDLYAQEINGMEIISIYVPDKFYAKNIVAIAKTNSEVMRMYSPRINRFAVDDYRDGISNEMLESELLAQNTKAIDIYIPENSNRRLTEPIYIAEHSSMSANQRNDFLAESQNQNNKSETSDEIVIIEYSNYDRDEAKLVENNVSKPEPVIGFEKYNAYLKNSLRRPTDDICKDKHGKVAVEFSIDKNGKPNNFAIKYSLCGTADKEAVRLILNGSSWTLSEQRVMLKIDF